MNTNQPHKFDVVLGGNSPIPQQGLVLGGIMGMRLALDRAETLEQRQEILRSGLNYGREGIGIILQYLRDRELRMRQFAHDLLIGIEDERVKKALALFSESGFYYFELQELLRAKRWEIANEWTQAIIKQISRSPMQINTINITHIPCDDLLIIDRLWQQFSLDRFGFSVQAEIWHGCQQLRWDENQALAIFGDRVGWRSNNILFNSYHWKSYDELNFTQKAPKGHLPWINGIFVIRALHDRIKGCKHN